jgi:hypothetical protein
MRPLRRRERVAAPAEETTGHATTAAAPAGPTTTAAGSPQEPAPARGEDAPVTGERAPVGERERAPAPTGRRGVRGRTRDAGAATVGALGTAVLTVARLVMAIAVLIAVLIGLAIVLVLLDANTSNTIVKGIHEGANFFAGSFTGLITFSGTHPKREIVVNWGIALVVYLVVGALLSRLIARVGRSGLRFEQRHRTVSAH